MRLKKCGRTIQEILDSDDELSTSDYVEESYVPAYQNNTRFDHLEEVSSNSHEQIRETIDISKIKISNPTENVKKAIFSKKDTFCLQCVQNNIPTETLLWFFKFLLFKDCHSNYKFLSSCLVSADELNFSRTISMSMTDDNMPNCRYKVVVKNNIEM